MEQQFDLVVIGTGSAGSTVAHDCRSAGWRVAIVDSRPFGGTCALRGCDPKKVLVGAAELMHWTERMQGKGAPEGHSGIDWPALMRFKRTFTDPVPQNREQGYAKAGIAAFHGRVGFEGPTTLRLESHAGSDVLTARHIVIAAGAKPATLGITGEQHVVTSDKFLELDQLPKRIAFVGGGYISFEFAYIAANAGAKVTILHRGPRPLVGFDPELVDRLVEATRETGIDIRLNAAVKGVEKRGEGFAIDFAIDSGDETLETDLVVHGAGRVPEIDDMRLAKGNVEHTRKGVSVNEYLQSVSNPAGYAAGDAADTPGMPLTPVAGAEGRVVGKNLLHGNGEKPDYRAIPTVVFTIPSLASVGLMEATAKDRGLQFKVNSGDSSKWYSSRRVGLNHSGFKVLVEENSDRILGAHLFGPHAEEVINVFAQAIRFNLTASDLRKSIYAYPTSASDIPYML